MGQASRRFRFRRLVATIQRLSQRTIEYRIRLDTASPAATIEDFHAARSRAAHGGAPEAPFRWAVPLVERIGLSRLLKEASELALNFFCERSGSVGRLGVSDRTAAWPLAGGPGQI